jgi:predicted dehydrogenase
MIRVAMLSFWHVHARDYAREAVHHPGVELVAAWDEQAERGQAEAKARGLHFYEHLDELLAQPAIDAVIVATPTNLHHSVLIAAANAHKHIFTEKVLAPTLHECNEIVAAITRAGVELTVSLPRLNAGYTQAIQNILAQNILGTLTEIRIRLSHNGAISTQEHPHGWLPAHFFNKEQCLGGAMIDLGCHPMYLTRLFLGMPESVSAHYGYVTGREVEDNAVVVLCYPHGALGIVEAGFVNRYSPFSIEVHGTEGSLLYGTPQNNLFVRSSLVHDGQQWEIEQNLPAEYPTAFQQWVAHIEQGTTATENIQMALDLSTLMEAANLSAAQQRPIRLDTLQN